ncbi:putative subtilisin-like protease precursor [Neoconidiobolus thromboides FSU 785]|nr:putative subtilisin-like protease precursor [Neoconidiobolus thromboides FSU 785]
MRVITILAISSSLISAIFAELAPLRQVKNSIPDEYIINLKKDTRTTIDAHLDVVQSLFKDRSDSNKIKNVYKNLGKMYHAKFTPEILDKVRNLPDVDFVETDGKVSIQAVQTNAPWGLARISQRQFTNKSTYTYNGDGNGVVVYVVDTGIAIGHPEFEGRAVWGANFVNGSPNNDENGHGSHCAGTIGSRTYGVSKKVTIVAVKVLDKNGSGSWSGIISGFNWVAGDRRGAKGNIISASLGGGKIDSVNNAVDAATSKGVLCVVAAGNDNKDACDVSPASAQTAFTVGASDINDNKASFSNYGQCVDIIAPGVNVLSTWNNGGTNTISGTSMATPHVAGLAAYYYSQGSYTIPQIKAQLQNTSTKNAIKGFSSTTKNYLAYNSVA